MGKADLLRLPALQESPLRFRTRDSVPCIFNHQPVAGDSFSREYTQTLERPPADLQPEPSDRWVNRARFRAGS